MSKSDISFTDASALLAMMLGTQDSLDTLYDLRKLPRKMMEIERKYRLSRDGSVDLAIVDFLARFGTFVRDSDARIESLVTFVGIDQYFIVKKGADEFHFRYRMGANRPPELTVKFQIEKGSNIMRGEINLGVRYVSSENVRAFMAVVAGLGDSYELFAVQQSGNIWVLEDQDAGLVEVVQYKTDRISPSKKIEGFVEIEPLNSKDPAAVIRTIKKYEKALDIEGLQCAQSIAELFRAGGVQK